MQSLTRDEISGLRSLSDSELAEFLDQIRDKLGVEAADRYRRQVKADTSRTELAEFFGVAFDTIDLWKRKGMPFEGKNGIESMYCKGDCAKWLAQQKVLKVGDSESERVDLELKEERLRKAKLDREIKEGTLVNVSRVEPMLRSVATKWRNRIETFHKTFGDEAIIALNEIADEIEDEINQKFGELESGAASVSESVSVDEEADVPDDEGIR